jgi:hypothetical protein
MSIEYDNKGKVFTHIVRKDAVYVRIQTATHQIQGEIYLRGVHKWLGECCQEMRNIAGWQIPYRIGNHYQL